MLLRNSLALNCKTVEILEGEDEAEESRDVIRLNEAWAVHDKPSKNKGRFTFEVRTGGRKGMGEGVGEGEREERREGEEEEETMAECVMQRIQEEA